MSAPGVRTEDYSCAEIARIPGVPPGTVKSCLARGLAQLKKLLLKAPHDGERAVGLKL